MIMTRTDFIRLPSELAGLVSEVTVEYTNEAGIEHQLLWQDADVWVLFQESAMKSGVGIVTRRVVIAAYDPPHPEGKGRELRFMPDIVVERSDVALIAPATTREAWAKGLTLTVPQLWHLFLSDPSQAKTQIREKVVAAWNQAKNLPDNLASEPLW